MSRVETVKIPSSEQYDDDDSGGRAQNPLAMVHECLRGRYLLALSLLVVGGLLGAAVGWKLSPPIFATTAQIQIKPILPRILYQNEQNEAIPRFDAFVESQLSLIRSNRVIDAAMQRPEWHEKKVTPPTSSDMYTGMSAWRTKNGEVLSVYMEHRNPRVAYMSVQTIVKTYVDLYVTTDKQSAEERLAVLEKRHATLSEQRDELQKQLLTIAQEYGSSSLEPIYQSKLGELNNLDREMNRIRLAIAHAEATSPATQPAGAAAAATPPVTLEEAARQSTDVRQQLHLLRAAEYDLTRMQGRLGPNHLDMIEKRRIVAELQRNLDGAMKAYEAARPEGAAPANPATTLAALRASEQRIQKLFDELRQETVTLGRKQLQIEGLRAEVETVTGRLKEVDSRIDQINVESGLGGRISVITYGDPPKTPVKDKRLTITAAGGFGGGMIGPALLIVLGLIDGRFRSTTDARAKLGGPTRILGALPYLPDGASDPEELASAAHGIHQIRVLLQVQGSRDGHRVFALTSSSPGVGKTSIALALGYSFAGSASRTLLIDLDLISGGLSARTSELPRLPAPRLVKPRSFESLQFVAPPDEKPLPADPAEEATTYVTPFEQLSQFNGSIHPGFETIDGAGGHRDDSFSSPPLPVVRSGVEHGIPLHRGRPNGHDEGDDDNGRGGGRSRAPGLLDLMEGMPLGDCLTQTDEPNLSVLSLGGAGPEHVSRLSPDLLRRVIREARGRYDIVLIDTGPIMGSIEATMIASEVDAVLLAVSRGEQRSLTEQAIEMVASAGARIGGIIFNRAASIDVMMSGSANRSGFAGAAARFGGTSRGGRGGRAARLGPLAGAVVTSGQSEN